MAGRGSRKGISRDVFAKRVDLFYLLSDPTRLQILLLLASGERCVADIVAGLDTPSPTITSDLRYLRTVNYVTTRPQGNHIFYKLAEGIAGGSGDTILRIDRDDMSVQVRREGRT